jgi:hypothetical protein
MLDHGNYRNNNIPKKKHLTKIHIFHTSRNKMKK